MTLTEFRTSFAEEIEEGITLGELEEATMCDYIEYNFFDGDFEFVKQNKLSTEKLEKLIKDIDLVFGVHDVEVKDITFVERINMKNKIKLLFKYGVEEQKVIEKDVMRASVEYYKMKGVV